MPGRIVPFVYLSRAGNDLPKSERRRFALPPRSGTIPGKSYAKRDGPIRFRAPLCGHARCCVRFYGPRRCGGGPKTLALAGRESGLELSAVDAPGIPVSSVMRVLPEPPAFMTKMSAL